MGPTKRFIFSTFVYLLDLILRRASSPRRQCPSVHAAPPPTAVRYISSTARSAGGTRVAPHVPGHGPLCAGTCEGLRWAIIPLTGPAPYFRAEDPASTGTAPLRYIVATPN